MFSYTGQNGFFPFNKRLCADINLELKKQFPLYTDDSYLDLLKQKIKSAIDAYTAYAKKHNLGLWHHHGANGIEKVSRFESRTLNFASLGNIEGLLLCLLEFFNSDTTGFIYNTGGKIRTNPHSFISFLLNELKTENCIMRRIFPMSKEKINVNQLSQIDFTENSPLANKFRVKAVDNIRRLHIESENSRQKNHLLNVLKSYNLPLQNHTQFIVGECHSDISPKKFLIDYMGKLKQVGIKILFMEHLYYDDQELLDQYFFGNSLELPEKLSKRLRQLDWGWGVGHNQPITRKVWSENNYTALVKAAKEAGIRIVALDTEYGYTLQDTDMFGAPLSDLRYVTFHYSAFRIIQAETLNFNPTMPWCALVGNSHVKTTYPQIPGLADMTGAKSVWLRDCDNRDFYGDLPVNYNAPLDVSELKAPIRSVMFDMLISFGILSFFRLKKRDWQYLIT